MCIVSIFSWDLHWSQEKRKPMLIQYGPFPSCCLSRFRIESWCKTIVREMSLICIRIYTQLISALGLALACSNSEMGYLGVQAKSIMVFSEMSLICIRIYAQLISAPGLALKLRHAATRKMGYLGYKQRVLWYFPTSSRPYL